MTKSVEIYRDRWGIPHIKAQNEHDAFFAQGFATAQDRLWQMDFDRHQALGRLAELVGPDAVDQDRLHRVAGLGRTAQLDYALSSPPAQSMVDAYTAGVNMFLDTTRALPIEYTLLDRHPQRWENWHCLAVYKERNTLLGTYAAKLLRTHLLQTIGPEKIVRMIKGYSAGHLLTVPPGGVYEGPGLDGLDALTRAACHTANLNLGNEFTVGSNAWSIAGKLTQSGKPLVAGDSHRVLDVPNVYYQVHLCCPQFTMIGYAIAGMPGILHFCHNEFVAWGMTYGSADTQDLFIDRFREVPGGREYLFKDEWRPAEVRHEQIEVRGGEPVPIEITITHHGPVIAGRPDSGVAVTLSAPGLIAESRWADAVYQAMLSKSVPELDAAFEPWTDRVNNYAVADVHGNFGYIHAGKIPIRTEANGWCAVPGWTGEHEWNGYVPHAELPKAINPDAGYAITCNQRVAGHDYPYYVGLYFTPDFRARRIQSHLVDIDPLSVTVADMAQIHGDCVSIPAAIVTKALLQAGTLNEDAKCAVSLLQAWDQRMDRNHCEPLIYAKTWSKLVSRAIENWLGASIAQWLPTAPGGDVHIRLIGLEILRALERGDRTSWASGQAWSTMLVSALSDCVSELTQSFGEDMSSWRWSDVHRAKFRHPLSEWFPEHAERLDPPSQPFHGSADTPLAGSHGLGDDFSVTAASVNRYIHDPSDWDQSRWIVPLGASGHPGCPHYADQSRHWADVEYIPQLWDWHQIIQEAETHQRLVP